MSSTPIGFISTEGTHLSNSSILDTTGSYFVEGEIEYPIFIIGTVTENFVSQAAAFNVNYSDSGLFGIYTISQASAAGEVSC